LLFSGQIFFRPPSKMPSRTPMAVNTNGMIKREMQLEEFEAVYWTDSTAVLQMIFNTNKRFPTFVANRIAKIEEGSKPDKWRYVASKLNPADCASRGVSAKSFVSSSQWLNAPAFLWQVEDQWPTIPCQLPRLPDEFTVLSQQTYSVHDKDENRTTLADCFSRVSSWYRLKRAIAWILRLKAILLNRVTALKLSSTLSVDEIKAAEVEIIKCTQSSAFHGELATLRKETSGSTPKRHVCSAFRKLNPVLFKGVLRVGGRLSKAPIEFAVKHPVILPSSHHVM